MTDDGLNCKTRLVSEPFTSSDEETDDEMKSTRKRIEQREGSLSPEYAPQTKSTFTKLQFAVCSNEISSETTSITPSAEAPIEVPGPSTNDSNVPIIAESISEQHEGSMSPEYLPQTTLTKEPQPVAPAAPESIKPDVQIVAYNDIIFIKSKKLSTSPQKGSASPQKASASPQKALPIITIESPSPSDEGKPHSMSNTIDSVLVPSKRGRGRPRKVQLPIKITVTRNLWADWNPTQGKPNTTPASELRPTSFLPPRTPELPPCTPEVTSERSYKIINKDGTTKKRIRTVLKPQPLSRKLTALSRMQSPELIIKPAKSPNKIRKTGSLKQKYNKTISVLERVVDKEETEERVRKTDERGYNRDSDYHPSSDESVDVIGID